MLVRAGTFEKHRFDPGGVVTQAVNVFWHIWLGEAPVMLLSALRVSYFQQVWIVDEFPKVEKI